MSAPRRSPTLILLTGTALILASAFGQKGGSTGSPAGGAPGTSPAGGTTTQPGAGANGQSTPQGTQPASPQVPSQQIFLSGQVMLEDGTPPPEPAAIQLVCSGSPYTEGYTNSLGDFSITLGSSFNTVLQDASISGFPDPTGVNPSQSSGNGITAGLNERQWMTCEIRAQLAGYQSQSVSLMNRRTMDNPNLGTILLHRIGQSEGTMVSATTLNAPKSARKAYEKALDLLKKKKLDNAEESLTKAVGEYPRYAAAWSELGRLQAAKGDTESARHSLEQSIQADPKYVAPYLELSLVQMRARQWKELAATSEKATRLDPFDYPQEFFFNAVAHYNLREIESAEESARRAEKLDTRHSIPQVSHLLGVILAARQDYKGAADEMRDYLRLAPEATDAADARSRLAQFEKLIAANPSQPKQ
jgi:tetratricopeptide (TPR) repeat protein